MPSHPHLPKLSDANSTETSPYDPAYNCIAWALHDTSQFWWPLGAPDSFWPDDVPNEVTVGAFITLFESKGFERCESGVLEAKVEKIALYLQDSEPKHAARQL